MTVSAEPGAAIETLRALDIIKTASAATLLWGCQTFPFGLPERAAINSTFFCLRIGEGTVGGHNESLFNRHDEGISFF